MFMVVLFTIVKIEHNLSVCQKIWIDKMYYIHNGMSFSHKEKGNPAIRNNMDGSGAHNAK